MNTNLTVHDVKDIEISKAQHDETKEHGEFYTIKITARSGDGNKLSVTYFTDTVFDHKNCLIGLNQLTRHKDVQHRHAWRMAFDFFLLDYDMDFEYPSDVLKSVQQDDCTLAYELPTEDIVTMITEMATKTLEGFEWVAGGSQ